MSKAKTSAAVAATKAPVKAVWLRKAPRPARINITEIEAQDTVTGMSWRFQDPLRAYALGELVQGGDRGVTTVDGYTRDWLRKEGIPLVEKRELREYVERLLAEMAADQREKYLSAMGPAAYETTLALARPLRVIYSFPDLDPLRRCWQQGRSSHRHSDTLKIVRLRVHDANGTKEWDGRRSDLMFKIWQCGDVGLEVPAWLRDTLEELATVHALESVRDADGHARWRIAAPVTLDGFEYGGQHEL